MQRSRKGTVLRLMGVGWYVALCILGGAFGGFALDRWLDRGPVFTLSGVAVGLTGAMFGMIRMLRAFLGEHSGTDPEVRG